tara:strand:- start:1474 stop:2559 length:1086 start_codon:yes stop_codon:yes gene_type:complete
LSTNKKIVFASGGTGGHLFPAINLMEHFLGKGYKVLLITDERGKNFIKETNKYDAKLIHADTPINKNFFKKILSVLIIFYSTIKSIFILYKEKPDLVFGFGGYVSFPISLASKFLNLPLVIYENNMALGRANKYLLPIAKKIFLTKKNLINFPKKHNDKIYKIGSILNKDIINYSKNKKNKDNEFFSILILGGSQGAKIFGDIIPTVIKEMKEKGNKIKIIQQCSADQKEIIENFYNKNGIKNNIFTFNKNILELLYLTDLAISRCGASSLAELAYTEIPFIAVPLPHSIDKHQLLNAQYYENLGCCWILEQQNFKSNNLCTLISEIMNGKKKIKNVQENTEKNDTKRVYEDIETEIGKFI